MDKDKLRRLLAGETTPEEDERIFREARSNRSWDPADMLQRVSERIRDEPDAALRPSRRPSRKTRAFPFRDRNILFAIAASLLVLAGTATYIGRSRNAPSSASAPILDTKEYRTERGQRASITLPDGSAVQLGPESVLSMNAGYGQPDRVLTLTSGEAYFHVTHDSLHPFVVRTAFGDVRDLGTRFVIRARDNAKHAEVVVAEGVVAVRDVRLKHNELARLERDGRIGVVKLKSVDRYFAWTDGRLVFDRAPLKEVMAELSLWFDARFALSDSTLANAKLTTTLSGETLSEALLVLETALGVDANVENGIVTLARKTSP